MARRYYSSTAVPTTLSALASNSTTTITVTALTGYPNQTPWTAIIDPDTAFEEIVQVTNAVGTTLTVTRGVDGTSGVQHSAGAVFRHGVSGRDFDEANAHVNTTTGNPHSVTASDVGAIAETIVDAKGDLIAASADDTPARLAVGSNDTVLIADSGETVGVKWGTLTSTQVPSVSVNAQSDSYTLVLGDAGKLVEMGKATAQTLTVPTNASVAFPVGTRIDVVQTGAGELTIAGASGVTVNSEGSRLKLNAQWAAASLLKRATDSWVAIGNLKA